MEEDIQNYLPTFYQLSCLVRHPVWESKVLEKNFDLCFFIPISRHGQPWYILISEQGQTFRSQFILYRNTQQDQPVQHGWRGQTLCFI